MTDMICEHCGWTGGEEEPEIIDFSHVPAHPEASGLIATKVYFCPTCGVRILSTLTMYETTLKARKSKEKK